MGKYNTGSSDDNFYDASPNELLERAKDYSEGNKNLEITLLNLWKNGIKTIGCCIGHNEYNPLYYNGIGYIAFRLDNDNAFKYLNMIYVLYKKLRIENIDLLIDEGSTSIHFPYKYSNIIFGVLKKLSKTDFSKYNSIMKIEPIIETIDFSKSINMSFDCMITSKTIKTAIYNEEDLEVVFPDEAIVPLNNCDEISFPFVVKCNYDNINKITELIKDYTISHGNKLKNGNTK